MLRAAAETAVAAMMNVVGKGSVGGLLGGLTVGGEESDGEGDGEGGGS